MAMRAVSAPRVGVAGAAPIEVHGHTVTRLLNESAEHAELVEAVLRRANIFLGAVGSGPRVPADAWYPLPVLLAVLGRFGEVYGDAGLFDIGASVPANAPFPPTARDIASGLACIDVAFHMNHRKDGVRLYDPATRTMGEGIGGYRCWSPAGQRFIVSVCDNPYPCVFDQGLLTCMARRFQPQARLAHLPSACRDRGDSACAYAIFW